MTPTPFRMNAEDLQGDSALKASLSGVLESLNYTLGDVVSILTGGIAPENVAEEWATQKISIDSALTSVFPLKFKTKLAHVNGVFLVNVQPADPAHSLTTPFVLQGWSVTDSGLVSIPAITGLLVSNTYTLSFLVR